MNANNRRERGSVEVEATFILPIAILSALLLIYLSLFLFQRANLQACLETALVYYKNTITDTYVVQNEKLETKVTGTNSASSGNSYELGDAKFPYRGFFGNDFGANLSDQSAFEDYFHSIAGNMIFDDNLELTYEVKNYVIFKQLTVTATQVLEPPVNFNVLFIGNENAKYDGKFVITAAARVNIIDHDDTIRNADYAIDIINRTKLGEMASDFASKIGEYYKKFTEALGME